MQPVRVHSENLENMQTFHAEETEGVKLYVLICNIYLYNLHMTRKKIEYRYNMLGSDERSIRFNSNDYPASGWIVKGNLHRFKPILT